MISEVIFYMVGEVSLLLTSWLPGAGQVPLKLPWGTDDLISMGVGGYKILAVAFPPFATVLTAFLIYLGFRIALRLLRAIPILGRTID